MPQYPEHEKLETVSEKSQAIGEFLDWLPMERNIVLAEYDEHGEVLYPAGLNLTNLLAEFFDIDLNKLEAEKRHMLDEIRAKSNSKNPST